MHRKGFRGFNAAASLKRRTARRPGVRPDRGFRGFNAAASLKHPADGYQRLAGGTGLPRF